MPLPTDEKIIALAQDLVQQLDAIFGLHPGFRPVHAKGAMLDGNVHAFLRRRVAYARASHQSGVDPGNCSLLRQHGHSDDTRRRSEYQSTRMSRFVSIWPIAFTPT